MRRNAFLLANGLPVQVFNITSRKAAFVTNASVKGVYRTAQMFAFPHITIRNAIISWTCLT